MAVLILVRHGQSEWNLQNRFTGDVDVALTPAGQAEARHAGTLLRDYFFQAAYTSVLKRAIDSMDLILRENRQPLPVVQRDAALNERRYGDLQGLDKTATEEKYGAAMVLQWRRSFEIRPPGGESLSDTFNRVIPYYKKNIEPGLTKGKDSLVVAHGNSLRALIMFLEGIGPEAIAEFNLPTGLPRSYEFGPAHKAVKIGYIS